ncbi:MAG TPA: sugar phosphate isomerase/epimerase family protein [Gemmatimonadales bacterium]
MTSRREFLQTSAAILAASARLPGSGEPLPVGFSTLGCPRWDWLQVLDFAAAHGYGAVELRGLQDTMDLTQRPEFAPERMSATKAQLAHHGLVVSCLGSSANMHEMDPATRDAQLDEARRFIDLARALDAPYVRVFGNQYLPGVPRDEMLDHIARSLSELGRYARERGVTVLIESHGDFTDSPSLRAILERADSAAVALLWDAHHTFVSGKEEPEETVRQLGRWIRHTHLKDSVASGNDRRYVLTGTGDVPVRRQVEALMKSGYRGYYSFEWEKRWHPEIEEPEVALAQFVTVVSDYLRGR